MTTFALAIPTCEQFDPARKESLSRLLAQLGSQGTMAKLVSSDKPRPSWQWSEEMWNWGALQGLPAVGGPDHPIATHFLSLQDDVIVPDNFWDALHAVVEAAPDKVISLHTSAPQAADLQIKGERWARCYWLTGPGYVFPMAKLRAFVKWRSEQMRSLVEAIPEDNLAIHWAWEMQQPFWNTIPALVKHDTKVPSVQGHDAHLLRETNVPWDGSTAPTDGWDVTHLPELIGNPWMPPKEMERIKQYSKAARCGFCKNEPALGVSQDTGASICRKCLVTVVASSMNLKVNFL